MRIRDVYQNGQFGLSFEIFPPKTEAGDVSLFEHLGKLAQRKPAFVSCTYGAGGSTRTRTLDLCERLQNELGQVATAHFTCVGSTKQELIDWLDQARQRGIGNIMALRGDPPHGQTEFKQVEGGLRYANDLVTLIRSRYADMGIGVAGYPEKHPEAPDHDIDLVNLKRKVDAGADAVFTQLFFVNDNYLRFRDRAKQAGVNVPVVPGIMPITEFARIKRITAMSGTELPPKLASDLEANHTDAQAQFDIGIEFAIEQCRQLRAAGAPGVHFYVLNKSDAVERILDNF